MTHTEKTEKNKGYVLLVVIVVLLGIGWYFWARDYFAKEETPKSGTVATFDCRDNKSIRAEFSGQIVSLTLSDGRTIVLDHAIYADGSRYTNSDESFVFRNKGDTASVQEANKTTFDNCTQK